MFAPHGLRIEGEADVVRHDVLAAHLRAACAGRAEVHLDLADLAFMDFKALNVLGDQARAVSPGTTIVLDNLPRHLELVLDELGWHRFPGLTRGHDSRS
ncbi:STAS domain-containing protein [Actinomadura flavalba]|uniref:STAS domain-containing protein n=1 Tax=Actinomadura flavalba TaxID=1120938 RepID=UPI00146DDBB2|nr:STAS domain-containing protein [Actinomadura flavalba]